MTTPKMTGMTPGSLGAAFTFSPALLGASPAAQHLLNKHRSPAPLQASFSTPEALAAMGMGVGMTPGAGMTPGMSAGLGIPTIMPGMPADETKKRELEEILRLLALRPGRISEEGVERLAKRMGLEFYKESTAEMTTMSLGGKIFLLDIDFRSHKITRVALSFANTPGPSTDLAHLAASILHKDLSPASDPPPLIPPSLAPFADNLARLSKTDRLSSPPHLNCFTAITGIYRSLLSLHTYESTHLDGGALTALCKGAGHPHMHARGKIGLSIDYWTPRRFLPTPSSDVYRVLIEVADAPTDYTLNPITPVRTSSHWVTPEIKKPAADSLFGDPEDTVTDWLEPPLEELPNDQPPSSRFIARLDPPVAVPFQDEIQLFNALMLAPPAGIGADTLEALLGAGRERERRVWVPGELLEEEDGVVHRYRMHGVRPVYARLVHEVPFSHPKELAGVFAVLRQFVVVGTLLRSCFEAGVDAGVGVGEREEEEEEGLEEFLEGGVRGGPVQVDVTAVEGQGVFTVGVIFPHREGIVSFGVEVGRNADIRVVVEEGKVDGRGLERAVVVGEDLGVAVEWVRRR